MSNEEHTKEDQPQATGPSNEQVAEKNNLHENHEDTCNCSKGCSTRSCSCFQSGSGCHSSCGCVSASCENIFNHLDHFFGEDHNYSAHPCFAKWLGKKAKNAEELKNIDRFALFRRIRRSPNFSEFSSEDEEFREWRKTWRTIEEDGKVAHLQTFFPMVLSNHVTTFYYSFCRKDVFEEDSEWHCSRCQQCRDWREWHCDQCDQCTYGASLPCERCGDDNLLSDLCLNIELD